MEYSQYRMNQIVKDYHKAVRGQIESIFIKAIVKHSGTPPNIEHIKRNYDFCKYGKKEWVQTKEGERISPKVWIEHKIPWPDDNINQPYVVIHQED